jgi:hypothetical protein
VDIGAFEYGGTERDITSQVRITRGGFYFDRNTQHYLQQVTIQSITGATINGPLRLALDGLTNFVTLTNEDGIDYQFGGIWFVLIDIGNDNLLMGVERAPVTLEFSNPSDKPITYRPRVLQPVPQ